MNWSYLIALSLIVLIYGCNEQVDLEPNSKRFLHAGWEFSLEGDDDWMLASVPGVVQLDLFKNDVIGDPYWQDNELKQRWIENENWIYKTQIIADAQIMSNEHVDLNFKGLDTYAKVYLNDELILEADNMFRSWSVDIKSLLNLGENELRIVFESPVSHNREIVEQYPHLLPSGNEAQDIPVKVSSFTRKAAYQFGWDWGPRFVTAGIWRPVILKTWNTARIENIFTTPSDVKTDKAIMNTVVELDVREAGFYTLEIGEELIEKELMLGFNTIEHAFVIDQPKLWWPNGAGEAHLYGQHVRLLYDNVLLDTSSVKFGVRTIELVNQPDTIGTSFYFKVNGKALFAKGANYIPQDVFLPRVQPRQYEELIVAVKEANMNMLRVWGGGIYERDLFYDLCDQHGILVWQDFMFAGSLYPNDDEFEANVAAEVIETIRRLRQHACLTLWCGNNEIEVAWKSWGWQDQYGYSETDSNAIWNNYKTMFYETIPELVEAHNPQVAYTPTSPLSNWGTAENFNHSTMHYWGVWHGKEPFESFSKNVGRFMVEYGFQSFPSIATLKMVLTDSNLSLDAPIMKHRQKSYIGNGLISKHIEQYYDTPQSFEEFVVRSQEVQARGLHMAIRSHIDAQPHCMGSLFWQLNDCWPGPSWSVIDYYGNKKQAYEAVKTEFSGGLITD